MKKYLIALVVIIALALIAWRSGKVPALNNLLPAGDGQPVACTMEAKQCPDGSYVGRSGPKCEFSTCPVASTTGWQTYKNEQYGFEFQYPNNYKVVDDGGGRELSLFVLPGKNGNNSPSLAINRTEFAHNVRVSDLVRFFATTSLEKTYNLGDINGTWIEGINEDGMGTRTPFIGVYVIDPKNAAAVISFGFWEYGATPEEISSYVQILKTVRFNWSYKSSF